MTRKTTLDGVTVPRRFPLNIDGKRTLVDVHTPGRGFRDASWFLFGHAFGVQCAILAGTYSDAVDEYDEHYGERVDFVADASTIADYVDDHSLREAKENGDESLAGYFGATNCGAMRVNSGGTTVWVDHYEWSRSVASAARRRTGRIDRG